MTTKKPTRKKRTQQAVTLIVKREFVGSKTLTEALIPVIYEDLRRRIEDKDNRTFDSRPDSA